MNLRELLERAAERNGPQPALRFKAGGHWETRSYAGLLGRARRLAETLHAQGIRPGDRVGLVRENAPDWPELYFGIVGCGAVAVPMDPKLRAQEVAHILADSGAVAAVIAPKNYPLFREIEARQETLRHVWLLDAPAPPPAPSRRVRYASWTEAVEAVAEPAPGCGVWERHPLRDADLASLIYTSGTTGRQKGVMLSHGNFAANALACIEAIHIRSDDNFLLVLPLFHAFAFTANLLLPVGAGACISFVESIKTMGENMREVSPTVLMAVPLLLDKLLLRIEGRVKENPLARVLLALGVRGPVRRRVAQSLGGALRLVVSGGAPCDPEVLRGLRRFGLEAIEGYGLTEAAPVVSFNPPGAVRIGTVGRPLPGIELRILEPGAGGVGEIALRGPNVMAGYYRNPEAGAEVLRDGWLATGDLGFVDADGYLTISGRKKALIVNREGKNIYPEEVEQQLHKSPYILESLVLAYRDAGESVGEKVGAIVVPRQDAIDAHAAQQNRRFTERETDEFVRAEVQRVARDIADYKRPRRVQIRSEELEKTSTGKVKRYLYQLDAGSGG